MHVQLHAIMNVNGSEVDVFSRREADGSVAATIALNSRCGFLHFTKLNHPKACVTKIMTVYRDRKSHCFIHLTS